MKHLYFLSTIILLLFLRIQPSIGQELQSEYQIEEEVPVSPYGLSIGVKAGTQGIGGEVVFQVNHGIHLRLGGSYFKYVQDLNQIEEQVQGEAFAKVGGVSLLANFHIGRPFFISVGGIYNFLEADVY